MSPVEPAGTYHHIPIMINRGRAKDEARHVGGNLLPTIMLAHLPLPRISNCLGISGCHCLRQQEVSMCHTRRPDLE